MSEQVDIIQVQKVPADPRTRFGKFDVQVSYKQKSGIVRTVTIPEEQYNDNTMILAIRKDLADQAKSASRTITV